MERRKFFKSIVAALGGLFAVSKNPVCRGKSTKVAQKPQITHKSDCSLHNAPALLPSPCDCLELSPPTKNEAVEKCSYCGLNDYGIELTPEDGKAKRYICADCLIKAFDKVLERNNDVNKHLLKPRSQKQ